MARTMRLTSGLLLHAQSAQLSQSGYGTPLDGCQQTTACSLKAAADRVRTLDRWAWEGRVPRVCLLQLPACLLLHGRGAQQWLRRRGKGQGGARPDVSCPRSSPLAWLRLVFVLARPVLRCAAVRWSALRVQTRQREAELS
jgi:hypothetical protein